MTILWATNLLHFHLNKPFKNGFLFGIILFGNFFGNFSKKLGDFFQIIWSPWPFSTWCIFTKPFNNYLETKIFKEICNYSTFLRKNIWNIVRENKSQ
jgi:hypothetical protein